MKTEECFELKEGNFYRGTFKTKKAALKYLEEHFKTNYKRLGYESLDACMKAEAKNYTLHSHFIIIA